MAVALLWLNCYVMGQTDGKEGWLVDAGELPGADEGPLRRCDAGAKTKATQGNKKLNLLKNGMEHPIPR